MVVSGIESSSCGSDSGTGTGFAFRSLLLLRLFEIGELEVEIADLVTLNLIQEIDINSLKTSQLRIAL